MGECQLDHMIIRKFAPTITFREHFQSHLPVASQSTSELAYARFALHLIIGFNAMG
jgi:hypothetical protein